MGLPGQCFTCCLLFHEPGILRALEARHHAIALARRTLHLYVYLATGSLGLEGQRCQPCLAPAQARHDVSTPGGWVLRLLSILPCCFSGDACSPAGGGGTRESLASSFPVTALLLAATQIPLPWVAVVRGYPGVLPNCIFLATTQLAIPS